MGARRKARELGLQVLFQVDIGEIDAEQALKNFWKIQEAIPAIRDFAYRLARGVNKNLSHINEVIKKYTRNWELERIGGVDRNILRLATYEILYCADIPFKVSINEAVEMAKKYGTADSGKFINGILDQIAKHESPIAEKIGTATI